MNKRNKKAFTIVEMLVAIGLLVAMMTASIVVFRVAINSQQKAVATGDYMRSVRAVTQRLENDFSAIDLNVPFAIWFDKDGSDRIFFFANGTFEQLSSGNLDDTQATHNYGSLFYSTGGISQLLRQFTPADRYQDILTPSATATVERTRLLTLLNTALLYDKDTPATYGLLLNDQVAKLKVQMLYGTEFGTVRWYPEEDSYPTIGADSDFDLMGNSFGVFFNIVAGNDAGFYPPQDLRLKMRLNATGTALETRNFLLGYKPTALKFTITLNDPDGRLDAKTFTYIVRLIP